MVRSSLCVLFATLCAVGLSDFAGAASVSGQVDVTSPGGQQLNLKMTIDDVKTRFEMTGPDFSFFAFGFDTQSMMGYSVIVEGTDSSRTAYEQNLVAAGDPGSPQVVQNLNLVSTTHDAANNLSTVVLERPNQTGDVNDPVFSTSMTELDVIWAYSAFATPANPQPTLDYHGGGGRGFATIQFVPEPTTIAMAAILGVLAAAGGRGRRRSGQFA
jgi:hypothetical protein